MLLAFLDVGLGSCFKERGQRKRGRGDIKKKKKFVCRCEGLGGEVNREEQKGMIARMGCGALWSIFAWWTWWHGVKFCPPPSSAPARLPFPCFRTHFGWRGASTKDLLKRAVGRITFCVHTDNTSCDNQCVCVWERERLGYKKQKKENNAAMAITKIMMTRRRCQKSNNERFVFFSHIWKHVQRVCECVRLGVHSLL